MDVSMQTNTIRYIFVRLSVASMQLLHPPDQGAVLALEKFLGIGLQL